MNINSLEWLYDFSQFQMSITLACVYTEELPVHNFYMCIHVWDWDVFETTRLCSQTNLIQPLHTNAGSILF